MMGRRRQVSAPVTSPLWCSCASGINATSSSCTSTVRMHLALMHMHICICICIARFQLSSQVRICICIWSARNASLLLHCTILLAPLLLASQACEALAVAMPFVCNCLVGARQAPLEHLVPRSGQQQGLF